MSASEIFRNERRFQCCITQAYSPRDGRILGVNMVKHLFFCFSVCTVVWISQPGLYWSAWNFKRRFGRISNRIFSHVGWEWHNNGHQHEKGVDFRSSKTANKSRIAQKACFVAFRVHWSLTSASNGLSNDVDHRALTQWRSQWGIGAIAPSRRTGQRQIIIGSVVHSAELSWKWFFFLST